VSLIDVNASCGTSRKKYPEAVSSTEQSCVFQADP
jgi:hypothetical protein